MKTYYINNMKLHSISKNELLEIVSKWAEKRESRVICFANVHMNIESYKNNQFQQLLNNYADVVCPDGMPLVWWLRKNGEVYQERVYGPEMMLEICELAEKKQYNIGLYGSDSDTLHSLISKLKMKFPALNIVYSFAPPFRELTKEEEKNIVKNINESKVQILFVALGCPKQEKWIIKNKGRINAVMLGVGAAFSFHAGKVKQAPQWLQRLGFEWLYRLIQEPRRLWRRYLYTNFKFICLMLHNQIAK
ncbi:WecB/TagA/CpsF family glycosyltransferase [Caldicellulosiruptor morganii]|uniref:WecB/TagA/CpsF family glycosyltransferase n=1 Tax=Caldicellulosiruptor morganii TaxID=1387555 RepID=A0ABY7BLC7_9FIRM|nr:WecB/TagA/CpsF family glycosyltransferase [Caldicellulosiruptor morganii]WAM33648.1 WecB/TagA/CpsF family glycosyltransferase [Caldicellulosiruptor morganii]